MPRPPQARQLLGCMYRPGLLACSSHCCLLGPQQQSQRRGRQQLRPEYEQSIGQPGVGAGGQQGIPGGWRASLLQAAIAAGPEDSNQQLLYASVGRQQAASVGEAVQSALASGAVARGQRCWQLPRAGRDLWMSACWTDWQVSMGMFLAAHRTTGSAARNGPLLRIDAVAQTMCLMWFVPRCR